MLDALSDISLTQLALIAAMGVFASVVGGVSGYGTGALMPLVLVPIVGAEPVVPIIALSALFTNTSRIAVFLRSVDWRKTAIVSVCSAPTCALGAFGYSRLSSAGAMLVIGVMLVASVPLRRLMVRHGAGLSDRGLGLGSVLWGLIVGATSGSGVILLSMLMAAGLSGMAIIATDSTVAICIGLIKIAVFGSAGIYTPKVLAVAILVGLSVFPGAFIARKLIERLPVHVHTAIFDAVVVVGGLSMVSGALGH